jgi:hypothetical protein
MIPVELDVLMGRVQAIHDLEASSVEGGAMITSKASEI